jgi:hypothetical protein
MSKSIYLFLRFFDGDDDDDDDDEDDDDEDDDDDDDDDDGGGGGVCDALPRKWRMESFNWPADL